jgi:hypothetical protein
LALAGVVTSAVYVYASFFSASPAVRLSLRTLPVAPAAVWTLWFDRSRPFERWPPRLRMAARVGVLVAVMALALAVLGFFLDLLYARNPAWVPAISLLGSMSS